MKKTNIIFSIFAIAFAVMVLILSSAFPQSKNGVPGPAVFPRIISCIIICCALIIIIRTLLSKEQEITVDYASSKQIGVYITMLMLFIYFILMKYLGFIIDSIIMLSAFFAWFSKKKLYHCILIATVTSLVIYIIFSKGLNVSMRFGLLYF